MIRTTDSKEAVLNASSAVDERITAVGRLRLANHRLRADMMIRVQQQGFGDIGQPQMVVFRREGIDGRQPSEIAASSGLSKQSVNDALRELEALGYVTRTPHPHDGRARIMRLTTRGKRLDATIIAAGRQVESEWREQVGANAWSAFVAVLNQMAGETSTR